jgi:hypothetical protein
MIQAAQALVENSMRSKKPKVMSAQIRVSIEGPPLSLALKIRLIITGSML